VYWHGFRCRQGQQEVAPGYSETAPTESAPPLGAIAPPARRHTDRLPGPL